MIIKKYLQEYFKDWDLNEVSQEQFDETIDQFDEKFEGIYGLISILLENKESVIIDEIERVIDNGVEDDNKKDA
jgi:hypothetical protein